MLTTPPGPSPRIAGMSCCLIRWIGSPRTIHPPTGAYHTSLLAPWADAPRLAHHPLRSYSLSKSQNVVLCCSSSPPPFWHSGIGGWGRCPREEGACQCVAILNRVITAPSLQFLSNYGNFFFAFFENWEQFLAPKVS